MPRYTHPKDVGGQTTCFREGGETGTRVRAPIRHSTKRSPFFSGGHNYISDSTSATRLSSESHSTRLDPPVSAPVAVSASQISLTPLETIHDYYNNDTGDFEPIRGQSRNSRNVQRSSCSEDFPDRSGRIFFKRNTNRRMSIDRSDDEATSLSRPLDPGTTATENRVSQGSRSVSRRFMLLSIFRRNKTGRKESRTGATGRDVTEAEWKASQSRSRRPAAITTCLSRFRKRIKSEWITSAIL